MSKKIIVLAVCLALALAAALTSTANASVGCQTKKCEQRVAKKRVLKLRASCKSVTCKRRVARKQGRKMKLAAIAPHMGFLRSTGACESGTTHNLQHGLRATSPDGYYLGRYQFGQPDWYRAGGRGDPRNADWLEQAYRAVVWLKVNGRQSWPNC